MGHNVVTNSPYRESVYSVGRFSRLPAHSSYICCPLIASEYLPHTFVEPLQLTCIYIGNASILLAVQFSLNCFINQSGNLSSTSLSKCIF